MRELITVNGVFHDLVEYVHDNNIEYRIQRLEDARKIYEKNYQDDFYQHNALQDKLFYTAMLEYDADELTSTYNKILDNKDYKYSKKVDQDKCIDKIEKLRKELKEPKRYDVKCQPSMALKTFYGQIDKNKFHNNYLEVLLTDFMKNDRDEFNSRYGYRCGVSLEGDIDIGNNSFDLISFEDIEQGHFGIYYDDINKKWMFDSDGDPLSDFLFLDAKDFISFYSLNKDDALLAKLAW